MRGLIVLNAIWGLPQTLAGIAMAAVVRGKGQRFRSAWVMPWGRHAGLSLGLFVFVPNGCSRRLLIHEYGHCVQSLILGPLYIPVIVLPSLVWAGLPALGAWRRRRNVSYYALPTERWANALGEWACDEPSMGQALVD